jgi:hypothetical protein
MKLDTKTSQQANERPEYVPPRAMRLGDDLLRGFGECGPGTSATGKCQTGSVATSNCLTNGSSAGGNCNSTGGAPSPNCNNPGSTLLT